MNTVIIYHDPCLDGFCSAWLLSKIYRDAEFIGCDYKDPAPDVSEFDEVIIVDFSFDHETLCKMAEDRHVTVMDHHKTAFEKLTGKLNPPNLNIILDNELSGCGLVRMVHALDQHVWSETERYIADFVQDRDLWKFQFADTKAVCLALESYPKDFDVWDRLDLDDLIEQGNAIVRYQQQLVDHHVQHAWLTSVDGVEMWAVECSAKILVSEVGHALCDGPGPGIAVMLCQQDASFRSVPEIDASVIATKYGGGGHKNACGCPRANFPIKEQTHVN